MKAARTMERGKKPAGGAVSWKSDFSMDRKQGQGGGRLPGGGDSRVKVTAI